MVLDPFRIAAGGVLAVVLTHAFQDSQPASRSLTREVVLRGTVHGVIVPHYRALRVALAALSAAADACVAAPTPATLQAAQEAWREALLRWKHAATMPAGPLADHGHAVTIQFWPIRPASIEKLLAGTQPIDDQSVVDFGAASSGLSALEYLLFDAKGGEAAVLHRLQGTEAARRRQLLACLAHDLDRKAREVEQEWTTAGPGYPERFAGGGQDSINLLVNHLVASVEAPTDGRLRTAIALHSSRMLQPDLVESAPSLMSQRSLVATLRGAHELYRGGNEPGVDDWLQRQNPGLQARVDAQFQKAIALLESVGVPLETAVTTDKRLVMKAYDECKVLELLLKVDVVSALGVTLTFSANDGD